MKSLKIIGSVIVAALGAFGSYMGYQASQKTDAQAIISAAETKALMTQMNTLLIPQIQKGLDEIRRDIKEATQDQSADRERIARLEAIIEILSKRHDHKRIEREAKAIVKDVVDKPTVFVSIKPMILPMLKQQK